MEIDFITTHHKKTKRNYLERVNKINKAEAAIKAKKWGFDYWDGSRDVNYGGYHYDERWEPIAKKMIDHYNLKDGDKILDVGCGKGFLLFEFQKLLPNSEIKGIDISEYAIENAKPEIKKNLVLGHANKLPFSDKFQFYNDGFYENFDNDKLSPDWIFRRVPLHNSYSLSSNKGYLRLFLKPQFFSSGQRYNV